MKSGFKDPDKDVKPTPKDFQKLWNFSAPKYDERSSCFMRAGSDHGVGKRQPVGHEGNPKERATTLPYGRVNTMEVDETA